MTSARRQSCFFGLAGLVVLATILTSTAQKVAVHPKLVEQTEFWVVGIQARTTNAKEMAGQGVIPQMWGRLFKEGLQDKIPNKVNSTIYALYSGYASDRNGEYDFLIGAKVNAATGVPEGMVARKVLAGRYGVVPSATGPVEQVVPAVWRQVWEMEDKHTLGGVRAYQTDFEVYDQRSQDPKNSQVDVYIGLER